MSQPVEPAPLNLRSSDTSQTSTGTGHRTELTAPAMATLSQTRISRTQPAFRIPRATVAEEWLVHEEELAEEWIRNRRSSNSQPTGATGG